MQLFSFFKVHKTLLVIIIVLFIGAGYLSYRALANSTAPTQYVVAPVSKSTLVVSVSGSGQISSAQKIDIKPQSSGVITQLNVSTGQQVRFGQQIAQLDQRSALVTLHQAQASLTSAQANYQKVLGGSAQSDITLGQLSVDAAKTALVNAQKNVDEVTRQQDIALANSFNALLNASLTAQPQPGNLGNINPTISGRYSASQPGSYTIRIDAVGTPDSIADNPHFSLSGLETGGGVVTTLAPSPLGTKGLVIQFPGNPKVGDTWLVNLPNTSGSGYVSSYNSYQAAVQARQQAIANSQTSIDNANASLAQAQVSLAQKQSPPLEADVAAARSQLLNAQAQLQAAQNLYDNNTVKAPINGQVAAVSAQVGDQASSGSAIATVVTTQKQAQVSLNEVDAAKVQPGQKATLAVDAIDGLTLTGHVAQVDLLGSVTQGVVNYNVKIVLDTQDDRIKDGMSVTAGIITASKADVLVIPNSALKTQGSSHYVLTVPASLVPNLSQTGQETISLTTSPEQKNVEVGLANDTSTEITSGLNEGDPIITQTITSSSFSSVTQPGGAGLRIFGVPGGGGNFRGGGGGGRGG